MPRPFTDRRILGQPVAPVFKPVGIPMGLLEEVVMTLDEFEAVRLAHLDKLYHEQAAEQMHVSRPTFSRIIDSAQTKIADALVHGKALRIEGGPVQERTGPRHCCQAHDSSDGSPEQAEHQHKGLGHCRNGARRGSRSSAHMDKVAAGGIEQAASPSTDSPDDRTHTTASETAGQEQAG